MSKEESNIPKIDVPEFRPSIPSHMVDNLKDVNIKFLIEQVSIIKQQNKWQSKHIAEVYDYTRTINGQVIDLQKYKREKELEEKIEQELGEKRKKYKKFVISGIFGVIFVLYPFYITTFVQHGPTNFMDILKLF